MHAFPLDQGPGDRRVLELPREEDASRSSSRAQPDAPDGTWRMQQADVDRVQEFRKCIECFLCQDVCHVLREHHKHDEFIGPRLLGLRRRAGDASARHRGPRGGSEGQARHRLLQHHQVLHARSARNTSPSPTTRSSRSKERVVDEFFDPLGKLFRFPLGGKETNHAVRAETDLAAAIPRRSRKRSATGC